MDRYYDSLIYLPAAAGIVACAIATATDLKSLRIPNWLTESLALLAFTLQLALSPLDAGAWWQRPALALAGGTLALLLFGTLSWLGLIGFGDTKLMAALGLCVGFPGIVRVTLCTFLAGGVLALLVGLARTVLKPSQNPSRARRLAQHSGTDALPERPLPYAGAILLGMTWATLTRSSSAWLPF